MNTNTMKKLLVLTITLILGIGDMRVSYAAAPAAPAAPDYDGAQDGEDFDDDDQKDAAADPADEDDEFVSADSVTSIVLEELPDQNQKKLTLDQEEKHAPFFNSRTKAFGTWEYKGPMHITNLSKKTVYIRFYLKNKPVHFWLPESKQDVNNMSIDTMLSLSQNMNLAKDLTLTLSPNKMVFIRMPAIRTDIPATMFNRKTYTYEGPEITISTEPYEPEEELNVLKSKPGLLHFTANNKTSEYHIIQNDEKDSIKTINGYIAKQKLQNHGIRQVAGQTLTWRVNNYTTDNLYIAIYVPIKNGEWTKVTGTQLLNNNKTAQISLPMLYTYNQASLFFAKENASLQDILSEKELDGNDTIGNIALSLNPLNLLHYAIDIHNDQNQKLLAQNNMSSSVLSRGTAKAGKLAATFAGGLYAGTHAAVVRTAVAGHDLKNWAYGKNPLTEVINAADIAAELARGVASFEPTKNIQEAISHYLERTMQQSKTEWKKLSENMAAKDVVQAVSSENLSQAEQDYLRTREELEESVYYAGEKKTLKTRIALCSSGGGYRAMLSALGLYVGLENAGLYKKIDYNFGLSGGSWAALGVNQSGLSPKNYKQSLFVQGSNFLNNPLPPEKMEFTKTIGDVNSMMQEIIRNNALYKDRVTLVSPWGAAIAKRIFLSYNPLADYIMGKPPRIDYPFVVTTAVTTKRDFNLLHEQPNDLLSHYWLEFSHDQVSFVDLPDRSKARIPSMAFGRQFDDSGRSTDTPLPHTLAFGVGLYGSAMNVSTKELHNMGALNSLADLMVAKNAKDDVSDDQKKQNQRAALDLTDNILQIASNHTEITLGFKLFENNRVLATQVSNWARNKAAGDAETLTLADAGVAFNLPLPPALNPHRKIDVIIMNDGSSDVPTVGANELRKTLLYARDIHGFNYQLIQNVPAAADDVGMADIDIYNPGTMKPDFIIQHLKNRNNNNMMVFKPIGKNAQKAPLIIYFTVINPQHTAQQQINFGAEKFDYTEQEANELCVLMSSKVNKEAIEKVINDFMRERSAGAAAGDEEENKESAVKPLDQGLRDAGAQDPLDVLDELARSAAAQQNKP
ncbi:MAG: hypothetical protein NT124_00770 [Candidatus Dependentiae bacterium]|nr:hypothetical protein [Candidatus Dependentiae bacterium]